MICLKIRTFVVSATTYENQRRELFGLWFAWKFVPLWYQQQPTSRRYFLTWCCDLLENSYLCGISNNRLRWYWSLKRVVICLKIRTFVVSATTRIVVNTHPSKLWFAWKFVPLWYQQQLCIRLLAVCNRCDLLENSYLCGISNNVLLRQHSPILLWFAWKFVPLWYQQQQKAEIAFCAVCCDLLENSYLCGISNNGKVYLTKNNVVVICLKIRTFVVSATTQAVNCVDTETLWFAWKFVPLWYQQQLTLILQYSRQVVICLKIRTFVVSATTTHAH